MIKSSFVLVVFVLLAYACRMEVQNTFPDFEKSITLNSILIAGKNVEVHLSFTQKLDASGIEFIENANVYLFQDSICIDTLSYTGDGIYRSVCVVNSGTSYTLYACVNGFDTVKVEQTIPVKSIIKSVNYIETASKDSDGPISAVDVEIVDYHNSNRFYELKLTLLEEYGGSSTYCYLNPKDKVITSEGIPINQFSKTLWLHDSIYTARIMFSSAWLDVSAYFVELRDISYDYYTYQRSVYIYEQGRYPEFSFNAIPTYNIYSNVTGAYGIFASYTSQISDTVKVNR